MKKRVAFLIIDGKRFGGEESGLNMSFDVRYAGTSLVPLDSTFTLTNLNKFDMAQVVTNTARFIDRKRSIECWAGYYGNVKQIFSGQILQSNPMDMPDTSVSITAYSGIEMMGKQVNKDWKNAKYIDILEYATEQCDLQLNLPLDIRKSEILQSSVGQNWSFTGSAYQLLRDIQLMLAANNNTKTALSFTIYNGILYIYWEDKPYPASVPVINKESGLIGIPTPTEQGINLQVLLDVSLNPLQTIYVESDRLGLYDGTYSIVNIRHHGTLRGNDWYSDLECVKVR